MESPREDIGYTQPAVPRHIQKARDFTAHVLHYCLTHSHQEQLCREREGYEELRRTYPEEPIDKVLRDEKRFHP